MRRRNTENWIVPVIAALLLGMLAGLAQAQKIRERTTSRTRTSTSAGSGTTDVQVEITTSTGDSSSQVVVTRHSLDGLGASIDSVERVPLRGIGWHSSEDSTALVRMGEDITILPDQVVEGDVVSIGGNIKVLGRVKGSAVSIGGDVMLEGDGVVDGDAVSIGGSVRRPSGTRIGGQNVGMRFVPSGLLGMWRPHGGHPFLFIVWTALKLLFLFFVGWLLTALAERRLRSTGEYMQAHLWKSLFTGLGVLILFPVAFVLLLVTIVGIPLALLSPVALLLALLVGYIQVAGMVGSRLIHGTGSERGDWVRAIAAGLLLFEGTILLGHLARTGGGPLHLLGIVLTVFGYSVIFVSSSIGLGALVLSRFGQRSSREAPAPAGGIPQATPA